VFLHDQDALNFVFKNKWLVLPPKWNRGVMSFFQIQPGEKAFDYSEYDSSPKLIHYASNIAKPWYDVRFPERNFYLKYLKISGYNNIVFTHRSFIQKLVVYKACLKYYLNKFIRPFIPNIIEIITKDIYECFMLVLCLFINKKAFKTRMLRRRIGRYSTRL
jgi:lipopolysaccharide biosynthesis glycosyltransferase